MGRTKYLNDDEAWEIGNTAARPLRTWIIRVGVVGLILGVAAVFLWPGVAWWLIVATLSLQVVLLVLNTVRAVRASGGMVDSL